MTHPWLKNNGQNYRSSIFTGYLRHAYLSSFLIGRSELAAGYKEPSGKEKTVSPECQFAKSFLEILYEAVPCGNLGVSSRKRKCAGKRAWHSLRLCC
jgi:hypothetical protein